MALLNKIPMMIKPLDIPASLAHDVASQLMSTEQVLEKYSMSAADFRALLQTPQFKVLYREARMRWHDDTNTEGRIRSKSAMLVEDSLMDVYSIIKDEDATKAAKLESFKQLTTVADLGQKKNANKDAFSGARTTITINMPTPAGAKPVSVTGTTIEHENGFTE